MSTSDLAAGPATAWPSSIPTARPSGRANQSHCDLIFTLAGHPMGVRLEARSFIPVLRSVERSVRQTPAAEMSYTSTSPVPL